MSTATKRMVPNAAANPQLSDDFIWFRDIPGCVDDGCIMAASRYNFLYKMKAYHLISLSRRHFSFPQECVPLCLFKPKR